MREPSKAEIEAAAKAINNVFQADNPGGILWKELREDQRDEVRKAVRVGLIEAEDACRAAAHCETCRGTGKVWNGLLNEMRGCPDCGSSP
jgi:ferredoxin